MADRSTKILLAAIAAALWANFAVAVLQPSVANSQADAGLLRSIDSHLGSIYNGTCTNRKICGL
jgi:hypothetical protein